MPAEPNAPQRAIPAPSTGPTDDPVGNRRLLRSRDDRLLGGVAGGLGDYVAVDPIWFRLAFIALGMSGGSSVLVYLVLWLIVPERTDADGAPPTYRPRPPTGVLAGMALIAIGAMMLAHAVDPTIGRFFWPVVVLLGGVALVAGRPSR